MAKLGNVVVSSIYNLHAVSRRLDRKCANFARSNYSDLMQMEKSLDYFFLGLSAILTIFDGLATASYCFRPSFEANGLARSLMNLYGIEQGLYFAVIMLAALWLTNCYFCYRFSDWLLKRASIDFPVLRKIGAYLILSIWAVKSLAGVISWFSFYAPMVP